MLNHSTQIPSLHRPPAPTVWAIGGFAVLFSMCIVSMARADEVDITVDVIVKAGAIAGVGVGTNEANLIKTLLRCAVRGQSVTSCSRQLVLERMPSQIRPISSCMVNGASLNACGTEEIRRRLPPNTQVLATCISGRQDIGRCLSTASLSAGEREALTLIDKLKADVRSEGDLAATSERAVMRNLLDITQGVRDDDWTRVSIAAGAELYKAILKAAIAIALPQLGLARPVYEPVVDYIVQARADIAQDFMKAVKRRDAAAIGRVVTAVYLLNYAVPICAIPQIPASIKEATCGRFAKVVRSVTNAGGDVVDTIGDALKEVGGLTEEGWRRLHKKSDCAKPQEYYATHHAQCYHYGAHLGITAPQQMSNLIASVDNKCRHDYDRCYFSGDFDRLCDPSKDLFGEHLRLYSAAVNESATLYVERFEGYLKERKKQFGKCPANFAAASEPQFLAQCEGALKNRFVVEPQASVPSVCTPNQQPPVIKQSAYRQACEVAFAKIDKQGAGLRACGEPPQRPAGCSARATCGNISAGCAFLPPAPKYQIVGPNVHDIEAGPGVVMGTYQVTEGEFPVRICASNAYGRQCSEPFNVHFGNTTAPICLSKSVPRKCPEGEVECKGRCIRGSCAAVMEK